MPRPLSLAAFARILHEFANRARVQGILGLAQDVDKLASRLRAEGGLAVVAATLGELADETPSSGARGADHLRDAFGFVNSARAERAVAFELRSEPVPGVDAHLEHAEAQLERLEGVGRVDGARHNLAEARRLLREARISRADGTRPTRAAELEAIDEALDVFGVFRPGVAGGHEAQAVAAIRRAVRRIREAS